MLYVMLMEKTVNLFSILYSGKVTNGKIHGKYLPLDADKSVCKLHILHSTLAHKGILDRHCYSFIRPSLSNQWYKLDDANDTGSRNSKKCTLILTKRE